jgi:hypothetical protein
VSAEGRPNTYGTGQARMRRLAAMKSISITSAISANGGAGGVGTNLGNLACGGGGSGGAILLVAPTVSVTGDGALWVAGSADVGRTGATGNDTGGGGGSGGRIAIYSNDSWVSPGFVHQGAKGDTPP